MLGNREDKRDLAVGDIVYYKFNYIEQQSQKINVYSLKLSCEEIAIEEERISAND